ncbi:CPBP family intramembrane glutamic endopeptidase [Lactococcus lactis]|uniref:CPBP family intramembrane glutamic endopeptidase n=1 Tax=Lactococcus lactis TaxID=1358 RepID=UPI00168ACFFB|nr:CPBP family intramembrane glutamic endopeptidase [Lactococcus lactis]QNT13129.1 CPBP family intramembrane metalloprotease [Lactococcus lactis subsp. lactis]
MPIYEEILFRGVLLGSEKWLIPKIKQQKQLQMLLLIVLVTVNSIIFSSLHNPTNVISFVLYVIFGWISSSLYLYTKDLKLSIYLHQINNLLAVLSFF